MTELRDRLEELAARDLPRGADAVLAASVAEAERRRVTPAPSRSRRRAPLVVMLAGLVAIVLVVGVLALRDDRTTRPRVDTTSPAPTTAAPTTSAPTTSAPPTPPTPPTFPPPTIAFDQGDFDRVAWIDGTGLVTASSGQPEPSAVAAGQVEQPAFSRDGEWIAYVRDGSLHVMHVDGSGDVELGATFEQFEWSSDGDRLAWIARPDYALRVNDPSSSQTTTIDDVGNVFDFAWSPDGKTIAVSRAGRGQPVAGFDVVDADGSNARAVDFEPATRDYGAGNVNPLLFAGWQPDGSATLVWVDEGGSGSIAQDGLELWLVPLDGSPPHDLGKTLVKRSWVQWSPDGFHVAIVRSAGRAVMDVPRTVTVCTTAGDCIPITGDDASAVDPAWSPDGSQLAFVSRSPKQPWPAFVGGAPNWRALYATRQLWVSNADGSDAHKVDSAGAGIASPRWTSDGTRILFVRDDALWSLGLVDQSTATRVLAPIAPISKVAPPDAVYEPTSGNRLPTWESLVTWVR
jgi:TolB protein